MSSALLKNGAANLIEKHAAEVPFDLGYLMTCLFRFFFSLACFSFAIDPLLVSGL